MNVKEMEDVNAQGNSNLYSPQLDANGLLDNSNSYIRT